MECCHLRGFATESRGALPPLLVKRRNRILLSQIHTQRRERFVLSCANTHAPHTKYTCCYGYETQRTTWSIPSPCTTHNVVLCKHVHTTHILQTHTAVLLVMKHNEQRCLSQVHDLKRLWEVSCQHNVPLSRDRGIVGV